MMPRARLKVRILKFVRSLFVSCLLILGANILN